MTARSYIALIHKDADSDYGVSFPDFPGCVSAGTDLDDARHMGAEALALHIDGMIEDGEALPEPSTIERVMADKDNRDGVAVLISVEGPAAKAVRVNVTFPEDLLKAIDAYAEENGLTRSGFLARASQKVLEAA